MSRFVRKVATFLGLFLGIALLLSSLVGVFVNNQNLGSYMASLVDKTERLQSIDEPRIILIGDSNLSFGMDSAMLEEATGMPVINMGLHGGLGNAFHENMVKLGISQGDIVIICHTTYSDEDVILQPALAWITLEYHSQLWKIVRPADYLTLLRAYPGYAWKSVASKMQGSLGNVAAEDTCYSRAAFNEYGDIVIRPENSYTFTEGSVEVPEINDICVERLNELNRYVTEQGATLLVAGYPIGEGGFTPAKAEYDAFEAELREKLDCEVISHFTDYFIPYDLFYDTNLHLSEEGARIRTAQLIEDLQAWMNS